MYSVTEVEPGKWRVKKSTDTGTSYVGPEFDSPSAAEKYRQDLESLQLLIDQQKTSEVLKIVGGVAAAFLGRTALIRSRSETQALNLPDGLDVQFGDGLGTKDGQIVVLFRGQSKSRDEKVTCPSR